MSHFCVLFSLFSILTFSCAQTPDNNETHANEQTTVSTTNFNVQATPNSVSTTPPTEVPKTDSVHSIGPQPTTILQRKIPPQPNLITRLWYLLLDQFQNIIHSQKINTVLRNIATCIVNGAMEIVSYYFPPPLIPIIASAAGMLIPIEPVLMLRDRLPVTSYRRAFLTALNTFLGTFEKFKLDDNYEYDPYMTQRFNRRMLTYGSKEKSLNATRPDPGKAWGSGIIELLMPCSNCGQK